MDSKKRPLWLEWTNADPKGPNILIMYKNGDGNLSFLCQNYMTSKIRLSGPRVSWWVIGSKGSIYEMHDLYFEICKWKTIFHDICSSIEWIVERHTSTEFLKKYMFLIRFTTRYADLANSSDNGQHLEKWRSWSQVKEEFSMGYVCITLYIVVHLALFGY